MLGKVLISSPLTSIAQSASTQVTLETTMKSIGRPGFILIDNNIDPDTKKYAAAKEFLYQATCLALYALLVVPIFKEGAFKLGPKIFKDYAPDFAKFKNSAEYFKYRKYAEKPFESDRISNNKINKVFNNELATELKTKKEPEMFNRVKGTIEVGNILGSVLGLAVLAPQVSHAIIHPCLRMLGMEPKKDNSQKQIATNQQPQKLDTKA